MGEKITVIRCKFCNGKLSLVYPNTRYVCPACQQEWNIHWLQEDSAIIISPVSWTEYAKRERNNTL